MLKQVDLELRRIKQGLALFQRGADGRCAGCHQPLHQNHQKADVALLGRHGLVVAVAHIVGHRLIQALLRAVAGLPGHRLQPGHARLEQRLAFGVDGCALFGANHERPHPLTVDAALIREGFSIQQLHQPHELVGLALVRRGRQQQEIGRCFGQRRAQLVAGHLLGAAAHAVGFVDDDQIPRRRDQVLEALAVVGVELLQAPAAPTFHGLHRVQGTNHLVVHAPQVLFLARAAAAPLAEGRQLGRLDELKRLAKVQAHFRLPLAYQPLGRHHQDALHPATQFQLAQHQTGLDGLAQAHLIGQQVADTVAADGAVQCVELVRQRHHAGLDRRQQQVVLQRIQQLGCRRGVQNLLHIGAHAFQRGQIKRPCTYHRVLGG